MMAKTKKITEKEGWVEVSSTVIGAKKSTSKKIKVRPFVTDTANVSVKYGATIPTGDYASARFDVMISMPCYVEEVPAMYDRLRKMVDDKVSSEMDKITGD
jgi:hypothetical protein